MKTFHEWLNERHPEMLDEGMLQDLADRSGLKGLVAGAGIFLGGMGLGGGRADAAISAVPGAAQDPQGQHSGKSFNREFLLELAPEIRPGVSVEKLEQMSDWDLWHWQQEHVTRLEMDMAARANVRATRHSSVGMKKWPKWYLKFGSYYGWKPVPPPSVQPGPRATLGGGR